MRAPIVPYLPKTNEGANSEMPCGLGVKGVDDNQTMDYVRRMAAELAALAEKAGRPFVAYLLKMAAKA